MKYLSAVFVLLMVLSFHPLAAQHTADSTSFQLVKRMLGNNHAFNFKGNPVSLVIHERTHHGDETLFYYILGMVLYVALIRLIFYKYVTTMFTLFFRATLRQQQLREQLLQAPLPALLLNIFFVVSLGTYLSFLALHYKVPLAGHFSTTLLYCTGAVTIVYLGKYIIMKTAGWIFGLGNMTDTYIFVIFLINKMIGIFLLPLLVMMAFPSPIIFPAVIMLSYLMLGGMLIYRFIISYRPVRAEIKLNRIHFFFYLCAFELAPLLLIYKVLLAFMDSRY